MADAPGETWAAVDVALRHGRRGLPGGSSLARLLAARRGVRYPWYAPDLTPGQILSWADAHRGRTGEWPHAGSGPVPEAPGETWAGLDSALKNGRRGLPGGSSLARLLAEGRGVRNPAGLPPLTRRGILAWADAHRRRTGCWPTAASGPVAEAPGETWAAVDQALKRGLRKLRGGSSLARLLARERGKRNHLGLPPLSRRKVLAWADDHHARTGEWPNSKSGPVLGVKGKTWRAVDEALRVDGRGLTGGRTTLRRLLVRKRGLPDPQNPHP